MASSIRNSVVARFKFTDAQRYAIWTVHGEKCWLCHEPVAYTEMHVDHLIPEFLEGTPQLRSILKHYGLSEDFDLNSWSNWVPAHGACNMKKRDHIFKPTPMILLSIESAQNKIDKLHKIHDTFLSDRSLSIAVTRLQAAAKQGKLKEKHYQVLVELVEREHEKHREPEMLGKPFMFAPGFTVVHEDEHHFLLQGPGNMVGIRPKGERLDASWDCPHCGQTGWNGTRCISCGRFIDTD